MSRAATQLQAGGSALLRALDEARCASGLSKAELARRSGLPPETVRRLFSAADSNPTLSTLMAMLEVVGLEVGLAPTRRPSVSVSSRDPDVVKDWLAHYGAPFSRGRLREKVPHVEMVLVEGLSLARQDSSVARALPVVLFRNREHLDFAGLRRLAGERGQGRVLGFFLELTAALSGEATLARAARPLRLREPRQRASQFFPVSSRLERRLAEARTPAVAKRWDFRMNMGLDSFEGLFRKFAEAGDR